ncbi:hypothetical protein EON65_14530 [archaeon]|nr:MAG: hypothetical protein EON65_14530 [archaeon]
MEDLEEYAYLEDLEHNTNVFSFVSPATFPFPDVFFHRKLKKYAILDCETLSVFQYPFVQQDELRKVASCEDKLPILLLGELQVNQEHPQASSVESSPRIKVIIVDHFIERIESINAGTGGMQAIMVLWLKDHEGTWYRLLRSFHPQYKHIGDDTIRMVHACSLARGIMPNYKICKMDKQSAMLDEHQDETGTVEVRSTPNGKHWRFASLIDDLLSISKPVELTGNQSEASNNVVFYRVEGWMLVDQHKQLYIKYFLRLSFLEVLWPSVSQSESLNPMSNPCVPVLLANKQITLLDPDASYSPYVQAVADSLFGASSVYRSPKKIPFGEEYFTIADFILHHDLEEDQHCAVHEVCNASTGTSPVVVRGKLKARGSKIKASSALNMVAYIHDYCVDINYEKGPSKTSRYKLICSYLLQPEVGAHWILLASPHASYQTFKLPAELIKQYYRWPGDTKHDVWRRITDYEILDADTGEHCRSFDVKGGKLRALLKGNLLPASTSEGDEAQPRLHVRLYPISNSIDFGKQGDADDNAGLWVVDVVNTWYKLILPADKEYRAISDRDWKTARAIISFRDFLFKLESSDRNHLILPCSCVDNGVAGKAVLNCSLQKFWELSKQGFNLHSIKADSAVFKEHMGSYICLNESRTFVLSFNDSNEGTYIYFLNI